MAHNADTDLTGVKVRSNPATAVVAAREWRAMKEDSSRGFRAGRPYSCANICRPTSVRIRARCAAASGVSFGISRASLAWAQACATATWNSGAVSMTANG